MKGFANFSLRILAHWIIIFLPPTAAFGHPYGRIFLKIFVYLWLYQVFVAARGLFLVVVMEGYSSLRRTGSVVNSGQAQLFCGTWDLRAQACVSCIGRRVLDL